MQIAKSSSGTRTTIIGMVRSTRENSDWKNSMAMTNPTTMSVYRAVRSRLNGIQTFNKVRRPVKPVRITAKVEICSLGRWRNREIATNNRTFATIVNAPGRDLRIILTKKLPRIRSLLGSKAKMKDGIPMVKVLIRVNWIGWNG